MTAGTPKLPIAVAIPHQERGLNIAEAVKSVLGHFEAVVVVDSHSTDDTVKIAEECGAEVVTYTWDGGHPRKKQWCLENVRTDLDWILLLDGDERLSPGLLAELRDVFRDPDAPKPAAYDIPLGYWFSGQAAATRLHHPETVADRPDPLPLPGSRGPGRAGGSGRWRATTSRSRPAWAPSPTPPSSTRISTR